MTITSVAVGTTKFLFGICDCMVDIDDGTDDLSLVLGVLHVCEREHMRSHVYPNIDPKYNIVYYNMI